MNYSRIRWSCGKLQWKPVFILTCNSFVGVWCRGERLIESPGSWFPSKFPSGKLKPMCLWRAVLRAFLHSLGRRVAVGKPVSVEGSLAASFLSTSNAGAAHLWEGFLLNLSSNCECGREDLPVHYGCHAEPIPEAVHGAIFRRALRAVLYLWAVPLQRSGCNPFASLGGTDRVHWVLRGPLLVSSTGDMGCSEDVPGKSTCGLCRSPSKGAACWQ